MVLYPCYVGRRLIALVWDVIFHSYVMAESFVFPCCPLRGSELTTNRSAALACICFSENSGINGIHVGEERAWIEAFFHLLGAKHAYESWVLL